MRRWVWLLLLNAGCTLGSRLDAQSDAGADAGPATSFVDAAVRADAGAEPTVPDAAAIGADAALASRDADQPPGPDAATAPDAAGESTLASQYPGDEGIETDPSVLFHSGFEDGMAGWTSYSSAPFITVVEDAALAHGGAKYLQAKVTRANLDQDQYISANARVELSTRVPELYWRFHTRFVGNTATPHHWVRTAAGDATYESDGLANTVPPGDRGFWFDLDARKDLFFNFYVYWYKMRSGRCNDGTAVPGCAGDQGTTYYYGNNFTPAGQQPFARDAWFCLEIRTKANTLGTSDGELTLWKDDQLVGEYRPGAPRGRWLRDNFYSWGQYFQDVQAFEGFEFRASDAVKLKAITLDAYYEKGTLDAAAPDEQVILYDDVVAATRRIGCRVP